jgi:hypothetical protein
MRCNANRHVLGIMDKNNHESPGNGGPEEAAQVIAGSVKELASLARRHNLGMLGYLLDMVLLEADYEIRRRAGR